MMGALIQRVMIRAEIITVMALAMAGSWAFVAWITLDMSHPIVMTMMPVTAAWSWETIGAVFLMWAGMMVAMMLPSAAPMVLAYDVLDRKKIDTNDSLRLNSTYFTAGYLVVWVGYSSIATMVQWGLQHNGLLTRMIVSRSDWLTGSLLIIAGIYQLTPFKEACLKFCRTPLAFLMSKWRDGSVGAAIMGLTHGLYCVGCCWALMFLMFVAGAMNPIWILFLTGFVALEKWPRLPFLVINLLGGLLILMGLSVILL